MDKYTATEQAYKHGYEKGYAAGEKDAVKWIPVNERLPEKHGRYLIAEPSSLNASGFTIMIVWYSTDYRFHDYDPEWGDIPIENVTHWMPLPEPPKEDEL